MNRYCPEGYLINTEENRKRTASLAALSAAAEKGDILEATALMCDAEHNIIVNFGGVRGIIPREKGAVGIAEGTVRDIALISRVGKAVCFKVERIVADGANTTVFLDRRAAQEECMREHISRLESGDIIPARITHLENFGAFCDIGCGCVALLPIDSVSVSRISHPRDRFSCSDDIKAVVKSTADGRILLTLKELLGSWEQNAELFSVGQTVSGIVRSIESYGIFVELAPNLAGLAELKENVYVGQRAGVYIKNMLPDKMKVKLVIIDSFDRTPSPPAPLRYFFDGEHIDRWIYSPKGSQKVVMTDFDIEKPKR